jgi:hypothetical protein
METSYDVISIHRQAAASDAKVATACRRVLNDRARTFADFIQDLRADLAHGIDESTASDLLWCFSNEEIYRELVDERGWSADRYEKWLAATLVASWSLPTPQFGGLRQPFRDGFRSFPKLWLPRWKCPEVGGGVSRCRGTGQRDPAAFPQQRRVRLPPRYPPRVRQPGGAKPTVRFGAEENSTNAVAQGARQFGFRAGASGVRRGWRRECPLSVVPPKRCLPAAAALLGVPPPARRGPIFRGLVGVVFAAVSAAVADERGPQALPVRGVRGRHKAGKFQIGVRAA